MTAAYSVDFRKKIVEAYESGELSYSKVAKNFGVSVISVKRHVKQYRKSGILTPMPGNQERPSMIGEDGYKTIQKII